MGKQSYVGLLLGYVNKQTFLNVMNDKQLES